MLRRTADFELSAFAVAGAAYTMASDSIKKIQDH
jgi:hypothetical protein